MTHVRLLNSGMSFFFFKLNRSEPTHQPVTTAAVNHSHVPMEEHVTRIVTSEGKGRSVCVYQDLQDFGVK